MNRFILIFITKILLCLILFPNPIYAQGPAFSQLEPNKMNINPSYAGLSGRLSFNLISRHQWLNVSNGYNTTPKFNIDARLNKVFGAGLVFMNDMDFNSIRTMEGGFILSAGYFCDFETAKFHKFGLRIKNKKNTYFYFGVGAKISYFDKRLDRNHLVFSDQLDQINGIVRPSTFLSSNNFEALTYGDISVGGLLMYHNEDIDIEIGGAGLNLLKPKQSFLGLETRLEDGWALHSNFIYYYEARKKNFVSFALAYMKQPPMSTLVFGVTGSLFNNGRLGVAYRHESFLNFRNFDALILTAGYMRPMKGKRKGTGVPRNFLKIAYSYDITLSSLTNASGGSHEITIGFVQIIGQKRWSKGGICDDDQMKFAIKDQRLFGWGINVTKGNR